MTEAVHPQIYAAMSKVMGAVGHIAKTRSNAQQGYAFRGIDDIYAAVQGPMVEAGVLCVPQVTERNVVERQTKAGGLLLYTTLTVKHTFFASDGSFIEVITVGEAMDSGDKSSNKAMSAAMKYAMIEVFCIPTTGDNDSENHTHEFEPRNAQQNAAQQRTVTKPAAAAPKPAAVAPKPATAPAAAAATPAAPAPAEMPPVAGEGPVRAGKAVCEPVFYELKKLTAADFADALWRAADTWDHRLTLLGESVQACKHILSVVGEKPGRQMIDDLLARHAGKVMAAHIALQKCADGEADGDSDPAAQSIA